MPKVHTGKSASGKVPVAVVRCVWLVSSCLVLACALLGVGATCYLLGHGTGPCPTFLPVLAFGVGGGLALLSAVLIIVMSCRNVSENKDVAVDGHGNSHSAGVMRETLGDTSYINSVDGITSALDVDHLQKTADVSYWIEQQKSDAEECLPLQPHDTPSKDLDDESVKSEVTQL